MRKVILYGIPALLVSAIAFWAYLGGFDKMQVSKASFGPYYLLYAEHTGPYSQTSELFAEFQKWRNEKGLEEAHLFGIYYDDP